MSSSSPLLLDLRPKSYRQVRRVIGRNVRQRRLELRMPLETLAAMAQVRVLRLLQLEGKNAITLENLVRISQALQIAPEKLMQG